MQYGYPRTEGCVAHRHAEWRLPAHGMSNYKDSHQINIP
jgi:hypothetical protein